MSVELKDEIFKTLKALNVCTAEKEIEKVEKCLDRLDSYLDATELISEELEVECPGFIDELAALTSEALDACVLEGFKTGINFMMELQYKNGAGYLAFVAAKCKPEDVLQLIEQAEIYAEKNNEHNQ